MDSKSPRFYSIFDPLSFCRRRFQLQQLIRLKPKTWVTGSFLNLIRSTIREQGGGTMHFSRRTSIRFFKF